jgi:hypothetical protein
LGAFCALAFLRSSMSLLARASGTSTMVILDQSLTSTMSRNSLESCSRSL